MYPVGVLFGLGFDTATEVALLVLAGTAVVGGLPFYAILSLPILFAAGMCLFDTIDGCFMNFAYDWAFARPVRKVFYNLTITGLSVFVAFFIGTIEILGLIGQELNLSGGFWSTSWPTSTSTSPGSSSSACSSLTWADRPVRLALRPHRGTMGRSRRQGQRQRLTSGFLWGGLVLRPDQRG